MTTDPQRLEAYRGIPMSVNEYLQLENSSFDDRYQYVNGIARMMPGGSVDHDLIAFNVRAALAASLLSSPCTAFGTEVKVVLGLKANGKEHYVYPDALVTCDASDRRRGNKRIHSPRVVVEVLSPSTEALDRDAKLDAYKACPSVQEILLVNQFAKRVELYRRDGEEGTTWSYLAYGPGSTIELTSIGVRLSMDEIYTGINFDEPLLDD